MTFNLYSGSELIALLKKVGVSEVAIYGDLKGNPYHHNVKRLVALGAKKNYHIFYRHKKFNEDIRRKPNG